jgi:hypothetical protein
MNEFSGHLKDIAARLPIPEPARSRVLLEIATDMEDLLNHHLAAGMDRTDAVSAVEEQFDLSEEALRDLVEVHSSSCKGPLERISQQAQSSWERGVLVVVAAFVAVGLVTQMVQPALFRAAGILTYVVLPVIGLALGVGIWKGVALFQGGRRVRMPVPRGGIRSLVALALLMVGMGLAGVWIQLYRAGLQIRELPRMALVHLVDWLYASSATLVVALSGAVLTGLLWFSLEARATALEAQAAQTLINPGKEG